MTRPARFSKRDLTRAVMATQAAGLAVLRTEFPRDGGFILVHEGAPVPQPKGNSCDEVFGCEG